MSINYKDAGVDVERGYEAVRRMKQAVESTHGPEVLTGLGGFGGLFAPDLKGMDAPVLVSGTDGVGTKLKLAFALDKHDTIGIDCVAMCVNDVICIGARPLFFLDYIATGRLEPGQVESVVSGIAEGCRQSGAALIGGETAEMPGFYTSGEYDVAGFCVGVVDRPRMIDGSGVSAGDVILGLPSSGVHSNGFSLVRKLFPENRWSETFENSTLGETLLTPTRIYVPQIKLALELAAVAGIAHITGGGFIENIPRSFSDDLAAVIKRDSWPIPPIFSHIQSEAQLDDKSMFNTFNMGVGMIIIAKPEDAEMIQSGFKNAAEPIYEIGRIEQRGEEEIWFE